MIASPDDGDVGQTSIQARSAALHNFADHSMSREQARTAVLNDLDTLKALDSPSGQRSQTALGSIGRIAEAQRSYGEALAEADPSVSAQAMAAAERQREMVVRAQAEYRQTPKGIAGAPEVDREREAIRLAAVQHDTWRAGRSYADLGPAPTERVTAPDVLVLKDIEARHGGLQPLPVGASGAAPARDAAMRDIAAIKEFGDMNLQDSAAAVMGTTADQHPAYRAALPVSSPQYAKQTDRAIAEDRRQPAENDALKTFGSVDRRDDAGSEISNRYASVAPAGLSAKDLSGLAPDRLAVMDSSDMLMRGGGPPHPREADAESIVAESLKSEPYRGTPNRESMDRTVPGADRQSDPAPTPPAIASTERTVSAEAAQEGQSQRPEDLAAHTKASPASNSMLPDGGVAEKRRAIPPLEDRFNVLKVGLIEKEYHFRDQAGKVAFTDKLLSISTTSENPAAIKAMVDRAAERGWGTVALEGSAEFVRQGWIAANAQGLKAVGHTPTLGDGEAVVKERSRLETSRSAEGPQRQVETIGRVQSEQVQRVDGGRNAAGISSQRQLAAAIEKALVDGKVSPEIRGQVRDLMAAEGARRVSRGDRFKVPVYDAQAPRARAKTTQASPQRLSDRERSR